jgi:multiple sugar transport system substrate-binding protein
MNTRKITRRDFLKKASAAAAVIGAAPVVAACGGAAAPTSAPAPAATTAPQAKSIKGTKFQMFWMEPSIAASKEAQVKAANEWAAATGVELSMETLALAEWAAKLATMAETKQGADIVHMYTMDVAVNAGAMMDVTDLADELGQKMGGWYEGIKQVCIRDGKWKALPAAIYGQYWHYRTDLFQAVGADKFPETWEELHQIGTKLKAKGNPIGFTLGHAVTDGATHCYSLLWSYGGKELEADGKTIALDSPETLKCLEFFQAFYKDALDEDSFSWNESGNNQAFNSKKASATNNANTVYVGLLTNDPELAKVTSIGPTPKGPAGAFQYMSSQYWGIPTYSKNPEAAKAFLRDSYYTLPFQIAFTKAGNGYNLPSFGALEKEDSAWPTDPKLAAARTLAKGVRMPGYAGPFTQLIGQSMNKFLIIDMFAKVAQGTAPKDAIKWAVNEMNVLMKG